MLSKSGNNTKNLSVIAVWHLAVVAVIGAIGCLPIVYRVEQVLPSNTRDNLVGFFALIAFAVAMLLAFQSSWSKLSRIGVVVVYAILLCFMTWRWPNDTGALRAGVILGYLSVGVLMAVWQRPDKALSDLFLPKRSTANYD